MTVDFFDYAEAHGLALFRMLADKKAPAGKWRHEGTSTDRSRWEAWVREGYMLGVSACASRVILIDVDVKVGPSVAYEYFDAWCRELGFEPPKPYCYTRSGGWHFAFRCPDGFLPEAHRGWVSIKVSHFRPIADAEKDSEVISVRNRGYCVAPGSTYQGQPYQFYPDAPAPAPLPTGLLDLLERKAVRVAASGKSGLSELTDVAALYAELDQLGAFDAEPDWFKHVGAIKLALGDTEEAMEVAREMTNPSGKRWERFETTWARVRTDDPGDDTVCRIGSAIALYKELTGKCFHVRNKIDWSQAVMSGGTPVWVSPEILPPPPGNSLMSREPGAAIPISEDDIALSFADTHGAEIRYVDEWARWLEWRDGSWHVDKTISVFDLIRRHVRSYAGSLPNQDARKLTNAKTVAAVEKLAKSDRRIAASADVWDADDWLLNTPGGVVDLRTGVLRQAAPGDYMTKRTAVAPGGDCPMWEAFLHKSFGGDMNLIAFVQRVLGYTLTGSTQEEALFFGHGNGGNGKGVLMKTVAKIMGDYAKNATMATFAQTKNEQHTTDLARLRGARLVTASETESGQQWAEAKIKTLTGGDTITARFMRSDNFEFDPKFKLLIAGNHKPRLKNVDEAIRRRFYLIPFTIDIPKDERDEHLKENLQAEWPGILAWMIKGCLAWQRQGLDAPASVLAATEEYLQGEDATLTWLAERCEEGPDLKSEGDALFNSWAFWAKDAGETVGTKRNFYEVLEKHGYRHTRSNTGKHSFAGIQVRPPEMPDHSSGVSLPPIGAAASQHVLGPVPQ